MTRPSNASVLMETARLWSSRSTCSRLSVGAVLARDTRILAQGYNGAPSGLDHCPEPHPEGPCTRAVHAEANVIAWAARQGLSTQGSTMYLTHWPCLECAKLIINAGVESVFFDEDYRSFSGVALLIESGIPTRKLRT